MDNQKKPLDPEAVEMELEEVDEDTDIIELTDEEGVTSEFQYLATMEHEGESYVVLMALQEEESEQDEDEGEVVILKIEQDENGEDIYVSCEDEEVTQQVFDKFVKMMEAEEE